VDRLEGVNWLGSMPPQVSIMLRKHSVDASVSEEVLPGLLVWSPGTGFVWLLLDEREGQGGRVYALENSWYVLHGEDSDAINGDVDRYDEGGDDEGDDDEGGDDEGDDDKGGEDDDNSDDSDEDGPEGSHIVYSSWVEWQRHVWREIELAARRPQNGRDWPGIDVSLFGRQPRRERLAMKSWTRRHEPGYLLPFPP
jgi:hypothetical protein